MSKDELILPDDDCIWEALEQQLPPKTMGERTEVYQEYYNALTKIQCETIAPYLDDCDHIIDLGCGIGRLGVGLYKMGICQKLTMADFDDFFEKKKTRATWQGADYMPHNSKEATKLIRVRVSNLNPNKKHSEGEFFRTGNSVITTISRFIPFESDTHIENMLLTLLKQREYCIVVEKKNSEGKLVPIRQMRREFQIEILSPLTQKELDDLSIAQSRRQSV